MPQGARVFIDRAAAGVTPVVVPDLGAGSYAVRVEAEGYLPWSSKIHVSADRQTRVHTTLAPIDSELVRR
jgi:PEGA domain